MNLVRSTTLIYALVSFLLGICSAQQNLQGQNNPVVDAQLLTLDTLFRSKEYELESLPEFHWNADGTKYYTLEKIEPDKTPSIFSHNPATGVKSLVASTVALTPHGSSSPLAIDSFAISPDESKLLLFTNSKKVWRQNTRGDYWVLDLGSAKLSQLGAGLNASSMMFSKFSPDASAVAFVYQNNLYLQRIHDLDVVKLTSDGSQTRINGTADWVNEEELNLRDGFRWSPDGSRILFWQFDTTGVREFHLMNNTDSVTPQIKTFAYPKVGETNSSTRLGIIPVSGGEVTWLQVPGDSREHYLPHAEWSPDGARILVQQFNRLQNELSLWLANPNTGMVEKIMTESDEAWLENDNPVRWINQGKDFIWLSERSGWRHAYIGHIDQSPLTPITQGAFDVMDIEAVDEANGWLYYAASPENATQRYSYRVKLDGSQNQRLSLAHQVGWHKLDFSPKSHWAVHTFSNFTTPPFVELVDTDIGISVKKLADNQLLRNRLDKLILPKIEFMKVDIGNDVVLDGWSIKPPHQYSGSSRFPLVMHVYGEPHGQTVRDAWPGARGLWHWFLAQHGFVVASVDNRGTNVPRGREWRKSVHRKIGIIAPQEQAAALSLLLKRWPEVDPSRVGIWGWSGGGSMSLHAIFRYPQLYRTAVSVAPVADQRLYDTIYQERYMGLPSENESNFIEGSPITHARNLEGNLLIIHGTGDDNCHYQGTERLMNELVAAGKHFSILPYPNRAHGVNEGNNTVRHFWGEITHFLHTHLQPRP